MVLSCQILTVFICHQDLQLAAYAEVTFSGSQQKLLPSGRVNPTL